MASLFLLIILFPIFLISIFLILIFSGRPIFFYQDRLGKEFQIYKIIKFRTMKVNSEMSHTGLFTYKDDPRVTIIGKYLRLLSIDELPQLINVLKGDMSLVGPRPAVTYELGDINKLPKDYLNRFKIKPGITGLAQISGRNELSWDQKVKYDNQYIYTFNKYNILYDIYICIITPIKMLKLSSVIEEKNE